MADSKSEGGRKVLTDREKAVRDSVVERFLETGEDSTAEEAATGSGEPVHFVRSAIRRHGGSLPGLSCSQEARPSFSKSYRSFQSGTHRVWTYSPTKDHLRSLIAGLRNEVSDLKADLGDL